MKNNSYARVIDGTSAYCGAIGRVIGLRRSTRYMGQSLDMIRLQLQADPMPGERWFLASNLEPVATAEGKRHDAVWETALIQPEAEATYP